MTTAPPPVPGDDEQPVPGSAGPEAPVLDSFAAEEPAEPAQAGPAEPPVLDSFAAEQPAEPADAATGVSTPAEVPPVEAGSAAGTPAAEEPPPVVPPASSGPRGSQGLTTAPPRPFRQPAPEPAADAGAPAAPAPAASAPAEEPVGAAAEEQPAPDGAAPRARRAWLPLTAVGAAVALLAGGTGWLAWQLRQQDRTDQASVDAIAAARDAARLLFSYDHQTLQADFARGLGVTTGDFRKQYERTTKDVVTPVATQYKAVVLAEVVEAAVVDAQPDEVVALVFLNQATTSTRVQGQQVDQSRVRMRLVPRAGRWLVEEVKAL